MTPPASPSVFTIAAGTPFVDALAARVLEESGGVPGELAKVRILLPTRRACRSLREAFLRQSHGQPLLLPMMTPLGDVDEDEISLSGVDLTLPMAIDPLRRQLLLSRLILATGKNEMTPDQAASLAMELARLLDRVHTERLSFDRLEGLVERNEFSEHWKITLDFLKILTETWPSILADENAIDPADRRNRLIEAQTGLWRDNPPSAPVIAAGSTGSIPATAELLKVIAGLPMGCVVLPGLDRDMDENSWQAMTETHPQFGMGKLLEYIGVERNDVADWPSPSSDMPAPGHARLINMALRPADTMGNPDTGVTSADDIDGITRINAPDQRTEAMAIALIMRHCLETPGQTAALLSPDRDLARRVAGELRRWNIDIDDSAGQPLAETPAAVFLRLTAEMVAADLAPVPLLGVLKHPLAAAGHRAADFRSWTRRLEKYLLRGPRPGPGIAGLRAALGETRKRAITNGRDKTANALDDLLPGLDAFEHALKPFARLMSRETIALGDLLRGHVAFAETLAATVNETGEERLWRGDDGEQAAQFISELDRAADVRKDPIEPRHYPALFSSLMLGRVVRPRYGRHPRLNIWGNMEARLQHADIMILGGLNEGTWPPEATASPWMSRPMSKEFGLAPPERMIGLSAHDFVQAFSASRVVVTRSERVAGTPTVPSRWLQRLDNLLIAEGIDEISEPDKDWLGWAAGMDMKNAPASPVGEPRPTPPLKARPRELPATRIETLIRDPYAVYARQILGLRRLDPIDAEPDAARRGTVVHDILDRFIREHPNHLPDDAMERLISIGGDEFARLMAWPIVRAIWWPRFVRIAEWFVDWERTRRKNGTLTLSTEVNGHLDMNLAGGRFRLTARADRIDRLNDGTLAIVDYKTGSTPSGPQIKSGLAPQLPLEALIAEAGGFDNIAAGEVSELLYVQVSGGRNPGQEKRPVRGTVVREVIDDSGDGLARLIGYYDHPDTPYRSRLRVLSERYEGDYDHLARVKEWGLGGDGDGGAEQ